MYADTLDELHEMAERIGMRRAWFQDNLKLPHYDLVPKRRALAVKFGAIEHDRRAMVSFLWSRLRSHEDFAGAVSAELAAELAADDDVVGGEFVDAGGNVGATALAGHKDVGVAVGHALHEVSHGGIVSEVKANISTAAQVIGKAGL